MATKKVMPVKGKTVGKVAQKPGAKVAAKGAKMNFAARMAALRGKKGKK